MMRAVVFMHCDECHKMNPNPYLTREHDAGWWHEELSDYLGKAEKSGWYVCESWSRILCAECHRALSSVEF
jgi:hypothetical protein